MRKLVFVIVGMLVVAALGLLAYQRQLQPVTLTDLYDEYHVRGLNMDIQSPFNGAVLVANDGQVVFKQAYGFADAERKEPLTVESRFLIGAAAKPLTAALVLQQVEAGVLDLEATLTHYLPEFPEDPGARITLHQLLSHSSGLPRDDVELDDLRLEHAPGARYTFSNFGYNLLVRVLERTSGRDYAELLDEGIVAPLGLANTGYAAGDALAAAVAPGLRFRETPYPLALFSPGAGSYSKTRLPADGAAYTSVEDFYRIVQALRGSELLSPEMTEQLFEPGIKGAAYGWFRNREWVLQYHSQAQLFTHIGALAGHNAMAALYDDGTDVIVLSNVGPLSLATVLHDTWLAAHEIRELPTDVPHPSLSSTREFIEGGGVEGFNAYYRTMSERAGYPIEPDPNQAEQVVRLLLRRDLFDEAGQMADTIAETWAAADDGALNTIGYLYLEKERFEDARRYFERNAELHPNVANVFDSLGEACEEQGDLDAARQHYSRASQIARANGDRLLSFYQSRVEDLEQSAASASASTPAP